MHSICSSSSLKQEFLKKWIKGIQVCNESCSHKKKMTILERKKAIKFSANVAMASTRYSTARWSRAVIANATHTNDDYSRIVVERVHGRGQEYHCESKKPLRSVSSVMLHKKILKKSRRSLRGRRLGLIRKCHVAESSHCSNMVIAKRLVGKKKQVLRSLVPGGKFMDDDKCLMAETLDYIASLRAQVHVMQCLAAAATATTTASAVFVN